MFHTCPLNTEETCEHEQMMKATSWEQLQGEQKKIKNQENMYIYGDMCLYEKHKYNEKVLQKSYDVLWLKDLLCNS